MIRRAWRKVTKEAPQSGENFLLILKVAAANTPLLIQRPLLTWSSGCTFSPPAAILADNSQHPIQYLLRPFSFMVPTSPFLKDETVTETERKRGRDKG